MSATQHVQSSTSQYPQAKSQEKGICVFISWTRAKRTQDVIYTHNFVDVKGEIMNLYSLNTAATIMMPLADRTTIMEDIGSHSLDNRLTHMPPWITTTHKDDERLAHLRSMPSIFAGDMA